jgi:sugar transferase (PEP-CTERM system associated)
MDDGRAMPLGDAQLPVFNGGSAAVAKPALGRALLLAASDVVWFNAFYATGASLILQRAAPWELAGMGCAAAGVSLLILFALGLYGRDAMYSDDVAIRRLFVAGAAGFIAFHLPLIVLPDGGIQGGGATTGLFLSVMSAHAAAFAARLAIVHRFRLPLMRRNVLVVGGGARARRLRSVVGRCLAHEIAIRGHVAAGDAPDDAAGPMPRIADIAAEGGLLPVARRLAIDEIVVASDDPRAIPIGDLLRCKTEGMRVRDDTRFLEEEIGYVDTATATAEWFVFANGFVRGAAFHATKRIFDIVASGATLLFAAPFLALAALAIRLEGPGPLLYRQERVGLGGKPFTLVKFRSMRLDAEAAGPRWAAAADPRVTRVGRILRATRLDEVPQVFNVLAGDMSFVGPRPERPVFVRDLEAALPFYAERHRVKPGITGWAQINYPYGASLEDAREKLAFDLYYVKNASLLLDVCILLQTLRVVLFQSGAR